MESAAQNIMEWNLYKRVTGSDVRNVKRGVMKCMLRPWAKINSYVGRLEKIMLKTE